MRASIVSSACGRVRLLAGSTPLQAHGRTRPPHRAAPQEWFSAVYGLEVWRGMRGELQALVGQASAPTAGHQVGRSLDRAWGTFVDCPFAPSIG
jgi:hypothetical protein